MVNEKELRLAVDLLHYLNSIDEVRELAFAEKLAEMDRKAALRSAKEEAIEEGHKKGHKIGHMEGMKEGRKEGIEEIAKRMISLNVNMELIKEATGLSEENICELKNAK